jgi:beta-galactosidase/beta-glucuronidase
MSGGLPAAVPPAEEMIEEYTRWMRDNWSHPSVFMWDANNETVSPELGKIINTVRSLDLSGRA